MKCQLLILLLMIICISCDDVIEKQPSTSSNRDTAITNIQDLTQQKTSKMDTIKDVSMTKEVIVEKAMILSVEEQLIMPSDYLTTIMTVKTNRFDTLIFLDMFGFEKLIGQEVEIKYSMNPRSKLLVCFDCNSYDKPISVFDVTASTSPIEFKKLKLREYLSDQYIIPASIFMMTQKDGETTEYFSNDIAIHADTTKMKRDFKNYGVVTQFSPELENRKELEKLIQ